MSYVEDQAAIAEFIRTKGTTRCPTACLVPTQGSVTVADKVALWRHAQEREELRHERLRNIDAPWLLLRANDGARFRTDH